MKLNHLGKLPREENSRRKQLSEDFENSVTLYAFQEMRSLASKSRGKEADRKDGKKDHNSRSAPEPKKAEENPASKFSSASKYAAFAIDGEDENEGDYTE